MGSIQQGESLTCITSGASSMLALEIVWIGMEFDSELPPLVANFARMSAL